MKAVDFFINRKEKLFHLYRTINLNIGVGAAWIAG